MALVGGPQQEVLRPAQLDDTAFQNCLQQMALFGDGPILDSREGTEVSVGRKHAGFQSTTVLILRP